jgi:hypothetical protein
MEGNFKEGFPTPSPIPLSRHINNRQITSQISELQVALLPSSKKHRLSKILKDVDNDAFFFEVSISPP